MRPLPHKGEAAGQHPARLHGMQLRGGHVLVLTIALQLSETPHL